VKGFLVDAGEQSQVCPEGHRIDDPELAALTALPVVAGADGES
jgi:hypothetical protein